MNELDLLERFRDDVPEASTDAWLRAQAAIAAAQEEESTEPAPSSTRKGSRRQVTIAAVGVAFAVAAIVVALLLTASPARPPDAPPTHDSGVSASPGDGVVRARVVDALSADNNTILYTQSSTEVPGQATLNNEEWDYPWSGQPGQVVRDAGSASTDGTVQSRWSLTFTVPPTNSAGSTPPNTPLGAACNVSAQRVDVDYTNRTWHTSEQSCVALTPGIDTNVAFVDPKTGDLVSNIKTLVSDAYLQVIGYPTVDGQRTIEITPKTLGPVTLDLWVNADTYLPVQSVTTAPPPPGAPGNTETTVSQYSFLNASQSNLAKLALTPPRGFTQTPSFNTNSSGTVTPSQPGSE